jgi:iron complex outermembrane receptor protein
VSNPVALALGSQPLEPEDSTSFSFGAVFSPTDNTSITLDYYNIEIDDRLTILENEIGPAEVQLLEDAGIENAALLLNSTANFFVNGFTSEIQGIDLSITSSFDTGLGSLLLDFRHNWNEQTVKNVTPSTLNASTIFDFENQVPQNRTVITADLDTGRMISGFVRLSWFDEWGDSGGQIAAPDASEAVTYSGEFLLDVEARFRLTDWLYVSVGGENVLDTTPEDDQHFVAELLGVDKSLTSPFGVNGGFWYVRVGADF